jgi:hypothetical protein
MIFNGLVTICNTRPLSGTCSAHSPEKSSAAAMDRQARIRFLVESARYLDIKLSRQELITRFTDS